ncbi:MAG: hypothetical protein P3W97_000890 [Tepidimonas sp.]|uniref:hypothetical protein n=1 Tax=Tepidimonas sp. TaxID=2002775 RepID=UPI00259DB3E3|nr:hypothetical protein [Tepidimonas sp.]MDM7455846.1 hypothetical protein [Tepidimonas sp.]
MSGSTQRFEAQLAATLRAELQPPPDLAPVLRRARRRLAARHVLTQLLGRIWLALARLFAPLMVRWHRALPPSTPFQS